MTGPIASSRFIIEISGENRARFMPTPLDWNLGRIEPNRERKYSKKADRKVEGRCPEKGNAHQNGKFAPKWSEIAQPGSHVPGWSEK
jgi:hypothetical protein